MQPSEVEAGGGLEEGGCGRGAVEGIVVVHHLEDSARAPALQLEFISSCVVAV